MKLRFLVLISIFFLLFILFFPLNIGSFDLQRPLTLFLFQDLAEWISSLFFNSSILMDFSSDSLSMLLLMVILMIFAFFISFFIKNRKQFILFSQKISVYYIAFVLLKYGADKLFKGQFYLPEPNILFTKFGDLDQDILFWSVMGTSRSYSLILGSIEVGIAVLLLFKKTRSLGSLLAIFTFINILIINFSFDISVKFFTVTLFLMTVFTLKDHWKPIYLMIIQKRSANFNTEEYTFPSKLQPYVFPVKVLFFGAVILQIFLPNMISKNWNDDTAKRPLLHGAYEIIKDSETQKSDLKYVFFHRDQYLIFMDQQDRTVDIAYTIDTVNKRITTKNSKDGSFYLKYENFDKDSLLLLKNEKQELKLKKINWQKMPALRSQFHSLVDQF